jgi:tape measure domain-containing protein
MEQAARRQERAWQRSNRNITRSANKLNRDLRRAVSVAALAVAGREVLQYEEAWRSTTNTIQQYSGILGPAVQATRDLNAVANDAGVPLANLGTLTGAAARAAGDLGRSRQDVLDFGEAVSKGAALANTGAQAVDGALIQLAQAISAPRVQLQEFNSIVEGTPRLALAFADGVTVAGGSVAELRKQIAAGNVSGGELFDGLLSQIGTLRSEFATLNQGPTEALNRLQNRIAEFVGTNDLATGSAQQFAEIINFVGENLDALTDAIIVGGAALAGALGTAALTNVVTGLGSMTKGLTGAARAMALLNGVSKVFGGPLVIAISAIAAGLAVLTLRGNDATRSIERLEETLEKAARAERDLAEDTARLARLQEEAVAAIEDRADALKDGERLQGRLNRAIEAGDQATQDLVKAELDVNAALQAQQAAIEATRQADLAAVDQRIAKNEQLRSTLQALAEIELAQARQAAEEQREKALGRLEVSAQGDLRTRRSRSTTFGGAIGLGGSIQGSVDRASGVGDSPRRATFDDLQAEVQAIKARREAGEAFNDTEEDRLKLLSELLIAEARVGNLQVRVNELRSVGAKAAEDDNLSSLRTVRALREAYDAATTSEREQIVARRDEAISGIEATRDAQLAAIAETAGTEAQAAELRAQSEEVFRRAAVEIRSNANQELAALDKDRVEDVQRALSDLDEAYRDAFESERDGIARARDDRIRALEAAGLAEDELSRRRSQANEIYASELAKIEADEAQALSRRNKDVDDQRARELQLLDDVEQSRDAALGRSLALLRREYEARQAQITAEISDQSIRNEALLALEENYQATLADVRQRALEDGQDFSSAGNSRFSPDAIDGEIQIIQAVAQERIEAIQNAYQGEIDAHQEAQDEIVRIQESAADQIQELQSARLTSYLEGTQEIFGNIAGAIESFGGRQSGAYKAAIAVQRAFTVASLTLSIADGISKAIALGFPQNIPVIAAVTAQGAQAFSLIGQAAGFQKGGHTGGGADTDVAGVVHRNEYVVDAPTTRYYGLDVLEALRKRRIPIDKLKGYQRGGFVGTPTPAQLRANERIRLPAQLALPVDGAANQINQITLGGSDITINGNADDTAIKQLRAELLASERRTVAAILPTVAADIRRGGGQVSTANESTYGVRRRG